MAHRTLCASALPVDVWADIFKLVVDEVFHELAVALGSREIRSEQVYDHRQYQSLRSVCRLFQTVFLMHPELSEYLFLGEHQPAKAVLSLLRHLQRDDLTITTLLAEPFESSSLDAVLSGALTATNRPLQMLFSIVIQDCSTLSLTLLSTCTYLECCNFSQCQTMLDISALRALPRLSCLRLQGDADGGGFFGFEHLSHLTEFDVHRSNLEGQQDRWMFSSSLQALHIICSSVCNMHEDGLSQCTALRSLCLEDCLIECQATENTLDIMRSTDLPAKLPHNLSALTQLTQLQLTVSRKVLGVFACPWLPKLTALKCLRLEIECGTMRFSVTDQMLSWVNLQHLAMTQDVLPRSPHWWCRWRLLCTCCQ